MKWLAKCCLTSLFITLINPAWANMLYAKPHSITLSRGYTTQRVLLGRTVGERETDLGFERSGYINEMLVNDGQYVKEKQVLATLDTARLLQNQKVLMAQREAIIPRLELARKNTKRQKQLLSKDHTPEQAYDTEFTRAKSLAADLQKIDADLGNIKIELQKSILRAPFHAVVLMRYQHKGTHVISGQKVLRLQQLDIREAHIGVPHVIINQFKKNKCYQIIINQKKYQGCVILIVPQLSSQTQTLRVIFKLKTTEPIYNGDLAYLTIKEFHKVEGTWVPTQALLSGRRGTWQIYTLTRIKNKPEKFRKVTPKLVEVVYSDGMRSYIRGDITKNTQIIAAGVHKYSPNEIVELIK